MSNLYVTTTSVTTTTPTSATTAAPSLEYRIHTGNTSDVVCHAEYYNKDYLTSHFNEIQQEANQYMEKIQKDEEKRKQEKNRYLRSLIKHVHWSGNTCIVYWSDGTQTKAHWDSSADFFDPEKAILVCIARKFYRGTGLYNEVLEKYSGDGVDHYIREKDREARQARQKKQDLEDASNASTLWGYNEIF